MASRNKPDGGLVVHILGPSNECFLLSTPSDNSDAVSGLGSLGISLALNHLYELGHRRIAYVGQHPDRYRTRILSEPPLGESHSIRPSAGR